MTHWIVCIALYLVGYLICFTMLRIEQEADKEPYTKGDRAACIFISFFSWVGVLYILIVNWIGTIRFKGYWDQPVAPEDKEEVFE